MKSRSKVRLSRALGIPLTPKAVRAMERRPYPPGEHGRRRRRTMSDYKERLLEKQRLRAQYNVSEGQFRRTIDRALRSGNAGEALMVDLESRLDALVLRAGFARTIYQARQAVLHGHVTVNGRRVDRPSYRARPGDVIEIAEGSRDKAPFMIAAAGEHAAAVPPYLDVDTRALRARLERLPERAEIPVDADERLVIEFYSR